ncbi:TPA: helix-turn-helix domain-containing protein [Vibrio parahaemolyticus]
MAAPTGNHNNNKYRQAFSKQAFKLCLMGARDKDLADFFDVHRDTIFHWVKLYPEFAEARKRGKLAADAEVAYSLFNRAMGVTVTKQRVLSSGQVLEYQEELPPDVRAMAFWLKCRSRSNWNPSQQVELSGDRSNPLAFILADIAKESENASPLP